jgi:branched-chain amino acid transport system permease protein
MSERPFLPLILAAAIVVLAALPWLAGEYTIDLMIRLMILALFALSLDLLVGYTGLVSFGHAAFFGLAGYAVALVSQAGSHIDPWLALPLAVAAAGVAGLIIGALSVTTSGIYFILITLAFAQMLHYLVAENPLFGGSDGLFVRRPPALALGPLGSFDVGHQTTLYAVVLACLIGCYAFLSTLVRAPFGEVLRGIRMDEKRTRALGHPTASYKRLAFGIAAALAGVAGVLDVLHTGYVSPQHLGWHQSGLVLIMVILGGKGTLYGPVLGAVFLGLAEDQLREVTRHPTAIIGCLVVLSVLLLPGGLAGALDRLKRRRRTGP